MWSTEPALRDDGAVRRHLVLVRHAKSAWDAPSMPDHERPLAPRGVRALRRLGDHLAGTECAAELVLCSSARRTVDTLDGIRPSLPTRADVRVEPQIYGASSHALLARLRDVHDDVGCVMIIGHNPGLQDLALLLGDADESHRPAPLLTKFPTAAAATLSFETSWTEIGPGVATIEELFTPRPPSD